MATYLLPGWALFLRQLILLQVIQLFAKNSALTFMIRPPCDFPGGSPSSSANQNPTNICYNNPGTYDVTLITTNVNGNDTLTLPGYITVYATPSIPTITQTGYTLTASAAANYQWQLN